MIRKRGMAGRHFTIINPFLPSVYSKTVLYRSFGSSLAFLSQLG